MPSVTVRNAACPALANLAPASRILPAPFTRTLLLAVILPIPVPIALPTAPPILENILPTIAPIGVNISAN